MFTFKLYDEASPCNSLKTPLTRRYAPTSPTRGEVEILVLTHSNEPPKKPRFFLYLVFILCKTPKESKFIYRIRKWT
jgi:hypothetical protein